MKRWRVGLLLVAAVLGRAASAGVVELSPISASRALAITGESVDLVATLSNQSNRLLKPLTVEIRLPDGWGAQPNRFELPGLAPYTSQIFKFLVNATVASRGEAHVVVTGPDLPGELQSAVALVSCNPLPLLPALHELATKSVGVIEEDGTLYVSTGKYVLFFPKCGDGYGPGLVYLRLPDRWLRMATIPAMGHAIYRDLETAGSTRGVPSEHWVFASKYWIYPNIPKRGDILVLKDQWQDVKGRWWTSKAYFAPTVDERVIKCTHMLWCTDPAAIYRYEGPMCSVGDGTFGKDQKGLLPPGPLAADQPAGPVLQRCAPLDNGVMAVQTAVGGTVAMMWDTRQQWTSGRLYPQALFSAPNVIRYQNNNFMSLLVPPYGPEQRPTAALAQTPFELPRGRFVYLRSELFVAADTGVGETQAVYRERFAPNGAGRALLPDPDVKTGQPDW